MKKHFAIAILLVFISAPVFGQSTNIIQQDLNNSNSFATKPDQAVTPRVVTPKPLKVQIDVVGEHTRIFHLNKQANKIETYIGQKHQCQKNLATATMISQIAGVKNVSFQVTITKRFPDKYQITVAKSSYYSWDKIEGKVLDVLVDQFGPISINRFGGYGMSVSTQWQEKTAGAIVIDPNHPGIITMEKERVTKGWGVGIGGAGFKQMTESDLERMKKFCEEAQKRTGMKCSCGDIGGIMEADCQP